MLITLYSLGGAWEAAWPVLLAAALATILGTRKVLAWLRSKQIMDLPNERSSHTLPTPRGGGLATTPVMALLLIALGVKWSGVDCLVLGAGALALMGLSWWDDRHSLPVLPRFAAHAVAIVPLLLLLSDSEVVFQGVLPLWLDRVVTLVGWLWFVNLYNFMDGIDGITGVETAAIGAGIAAVAALVGAFGLIPPALVVAAVGAAFLVYNWHPAKLFLGDSGSVPFGYVLGGLLVWLAADGHLAAALILPAYYLSDATITLGRRALNGEKVWQAHRKHFYQRAVRGGRSHAAVSSLVLAANMALAGAAVLAVLGQVWLALAAAAAIVAVTLRVMHVWAGSAGAFHPPKAE